MYICATATVVVQDKSGWMICSALAVKRHLTTVLIVAGEFTTAVIMMTYQLPVATVPTVRYVSQSIFQFQLLLLSRSGSLQEPELSGRALCRRT